MASDISRDTLRYATSRRMMIEFSFADNGDIIYYEGRPAGVYFKDCSHYLIWQEKVQSRDRMIEHFSMVGGDSDV